MKQVLQSIRSGQVLVSEVPAPAVPPNGLLVRTLASLVSAGTERMVVEFAEKNLLQKARARPDLVRQVLQRARRDGLRQTFDTVRRNLDQPMPLGYSLVGQVLDVGLTTRGAAVGDVVACAGSGVASHAEFAAVPELLFARVPMDRSRAPLEHFAFTTLGAIALHGFRLASPQVGDRVAVIGLGLLGQLTVQIARAAGCRVFGVDLSADRVALAKAGGGIDAALRADAEAAGAAFTGGAGFDAVLVTAEAASADPAELAAALARDRAQIVAVGAFDLHLPRKAYFQKELHFQVSRSYGPGRYDPSYEVHGRDYPIGYVRWTQQRNLEAFVALLADGAVDVGPLISHRFPVAEAPRAYDVITGKAGEPFLGVLLTYPDDAEPTRHVQLQPSRPGRSLDAPGVSVVGAGLFASSTLLPALKQAGTLTLRGIVSGQGVTARTLADAHGFGFCTSDISDVLTDAATDVAFILTRHHLHASHVLKALRAGKHVFVEKPLCLTSDELDEVMSYLGEHPGLLLMVGFNRRFAPLSLALKEFLQTGEPVLLTYRCNAGYLPPEHWTQDAEQGGGRLVGEACHFIDMANFLCGSAPTRAMTAVMADAGRYRGDNFQVTLTYENGSVASITYAANGDKDAGKERIEAFSGGRFGVLDDFRKLDLHLAGNVRRTRRAQDKGHAAACRAFLDAIRNAAASPLTPTAIRETMQATFAARESARAGHVIEVTDASG